MTTPYPGTDVYHEVLEKGLLPPGYIWDRMSTHFETCYRTDELSAERLAELYRIAYKEYYWRWPFVIQSLWRLLQNLDEIPSYTYLFKDFILSFK